MSAQIPIDLDDIDHCAQHAVDHSYLQLGEPPVILNVGRLAAQENQATLLRALHIARDNRPVRLILLGEGEDRPALERLAEQL